MPKLTKDILPFYKFNNKNNSYLVKNFSDTIELGRSKASSEDIFPSNRSFGTFDDHNTYKTNRLGFRGPFYEDAEVLASGCSITFGIGVPEEGRWTNFLSNSIGKNIMNLGNPGASVESICVDIIKYCSNSKIPKQIFCLFPDFFRKMAVVDKEFFKSAHTGTTKLRDDIARDDTLSLVYCKPIVYKENGSIFMEITNKEYTENLISPHQLILDSINHIYMLESFCTANNIELYWTTWDLPSSFIMKELLNIPNFKLKKFISFVSEEETISCNHFIIKNCNEQHICEFEDKIFWNKGSDYNLVNGNKIYDFAHPGVHFHYHIAEMFYNLYKNEVKVV